MRTPSITDSTEWWTRARYASAFTATDIVITVSDNGLGMTKEQCETILKKDRSDSKGIGVKNVNDRLKIYFGDEYGISIDSELDVGTTVAIRIPKIEKGRENEY